MTSVSVRSYQKEDHKDVNRIFAKGITDIHHIKDALLIGYQSPSVISCFATLFIIGYLFYSIQTGIIALLIGLTIHGVSVPFLFHFYVW